MNVIDPIGSTMPSSMKRMANDGRLISSILLLSIDAYDHSWETFCLLRAEDPSDPESYVILLITKG